MSQAETEYAVKGLHIASVTQIDFRNETSLIFPQKTSACNLIRKFNLFQFDEQIQIP